MNGKFLTTLLALAVLVSTGAVGCRKKPSRLVNIPGQGMAGPRDTGLNPARGLPDTNPLGQGPGLGDTGIKAAPMPDTGLPPVDGDFSNYDRDEARFSSETVYFDFDKSVVKASELPKLRTVADAMKSLPGKAVEVQGHCDERGTEEYNRALGERRALAVREQLVKLGLDPNMIPTISYGEDRPADPAHNDGAWAKNRRAVFILLSPKGTK